ncbi:MAG: translocation/assembly module TamB domain-containing protein [Cyanobacteria bacterium P01_F01_bin.42]
MGDRYRLDMDVQAPGGEFPASGSLSATPAGISLQGIQALIPGGKILASGRVVDGQVALKTKVPGINLVEYSEALRGELTGELDIQSPLAGFSSATAIAVGQVQFTKGISLIEDPIDAQVRWNGKHIEVQRAIAPGFVASGVMGAVLEGEDAPQLTTLELDIRQESYPLASLPFELPADSRLSGVADLEGRLYGQVYSPQLDGNLRVRDFEINDLAFEPSLNGMLRYDTAQGMTIQTRGQDNLANLQLNANQEPVSFRLKNQAASAIGRTIGPNQLAVEVDQVPLSILNWDLVNDYGYGRVSGTASGKFQVALPNYDIEGPLTVLQPAIGPFRGDRFAGDLQIRDGALAVARSELTQNTNRFLIDAQLIPESDPKFSGSVTIANAQVEDAIVVFETLEFLQPQTGQAPNYGQADLIKTTPVGQPQAPLLIQLQRLAEINQLIQKQQEAELRLQKIPSWTEITGAMQGRVTFSGSVATGVNAKYDLSSDGLGWASIPFESAVASGSYRAGDLEFKQLSIDSMGGNIAFQGRLGSQNQGSLKITRLPLSDLSLLLTPNLPVTGYLDAQATLTGSFENPTFAGRLELSDTLINQSEIRTAQAQFNFSQARLGLAGFVDINNPDPVRFEGSIPYKFPFMSVNPASNDLSVKLQVKDEGLALLNLLTDQLAWVDGAGEVDVSIQGTVSRPSIRGRVVVDNATLTASSLPAPLTQVSGELNFDQERVQINDFRGAFSDGQLTATGILPIFGRQIQTGSEANSRDTLSINLSDLALDLRGLYRGGVEGDLSITGSVFSPNVGGMVTLNEGQIVLSDATGLSGFSGQEQSSTIATEASDSQTQPLQFDNLVVSLEKDVKILQPPLLNFTTEGQLVVNGSIDSPRPQGTVSFTKGEVNLFTSFFRLNRRRKSFAQFLPRNGLDPYLNVNLVTAVSEVNDGRDERLSEFSDPLAGTLGSIESVRINASVDGRASQLLSDLQQAIELTSNPARSEGEIIALLSGDVAEAIQEGNTDLALANIASSAVLNRVQSYVDNAFGGRAVFRLFPVLIPNETEESVLAFGGEFGYDATDDLSVSVLQVLTGTDDPTRFNVNYDINDRFRARGSVSIDGEATGLLEYRFRF